MKERLKLILLALLPFFVLGGFTSPVLTFFTAETNPSNESEVVIEWAVQNLATVQKFELHRRIPTMSNSSYTHLHDADIVVTPDLVQNPPPRFVYRDNNLYKSAESADMAIYVLRIKPVNGPDIEREISVKYTTSVTRRTWGSIKSMFQ